MKRLLIFIFVIATSISSYGQKETLSINFMANITPPLYIFGIRRHDVILSSDPSMGYEASFYYSRHLSERVNIEMGLLGGLQSYSFTLYFEDSFIDDSNPDENFSLDKVSAYDLEYYGVNLGLGYKLFQFKRSSLGLLAGVNAIYFLHTDSSVSYGAVLPNNVDKEFFFAQDDVNPDNKIIIAPNLGIYYSYPLNKRVDLGLRTNAVVSNAVIFKNYAKTPNFLIFGDNETVKGSWEKRFRQYGIGLSVFYKLN